MYRPPADVNEAEPVVTEYWLEVSDVDSFINNPILPDCDSNTKFPFVAPVFVQVNVKLVDSGVDAAVIVLLPRFIAPDCEEERTVINRPVLLLCTIEEVTVAVVVTLDQEAVIGPIGSQTK
jgi:hypothetical protein